MSGRHELVLAVVTTLAIIGAIAAIAVPRAGAAESAPLVIAKQGYFFVGGKSDPRIDGAPMVGHMYVEFQIPEKRAHPFPVVMIHGGSQTGTNFTGTPDGREGWAQYFLRRGFAVYVVDQVARGRAAYAAPVYGPVNAAKLDWVRMRFVAPERFKRWPLAHLHTQWPGGSEPGDPVFDQFYASQMPSVADFAKQQEINRDAGVALLDKIGPAILLTHSQSGAFGWPIADARPELVKAIVAVEPSGPPVHDVAFKGAPNWFGDAAKTKLSGLGEIALTYDPPGAPEFVREETPDGPDLVRCWLQKEPARRLVKLERIPVLVVMSEASYHASYDHCTVKYLRQAGVATTFIRLAEKGIRGDGHMMMLEKNSDEIAAVMVEWIEKTVASGAVSREN